MLAWVRLPIMTLVQFGTRIIRISKLKSEIRMSKFERLQTQKELQVNIGEGAYSDMEPV